MASKRITSQQALHLQGQAIEAFAQIGDPRRNLDLCARGQADHARSRLSR